MKITASAEDVFLLFLFFHKNISLFFSYFFCVCVCLCVKGNVRLQKKKCWCAKYFFENCLGDGPFYGAKRMKTQLQLHSRGGHFDGRLKTTVGSWSGWLESDVDLLYCTVLLSPNDELPLNCAPAKKMAQKYKHTDWIFFFGVTLTKD